MALFTGSILASFGAGLAGVFTSIGTCLLRTNFEEFSMEDYHDRH
jgi:hypothetical protein